MIRVFLLDDHEVVRRGMCELLRNEGDIEIVGEAETADEATRRILASQPDVAILDVRLSDDSGIRVCRDVRAADPGIGVLMLTSYEDDNALFAAITAGASGYLLKQVRGTDIVSAVRTVAAGRSLLDPTVTASVLDRVRTGEAGVDRLRSLTEQERRILDLIAEGHSNRTISAQMFLSEKTVKNYVSTILAKLALQNRTQAAILVTKMRQSEPAKQDTAATH
ncbi:MAG TPA: response regulator transcription factor [Stackebrandtia sp.]|uniref:response regulator transcription factor n=1 Tax=Stackebrandtia sp. TaxID=2023065 RepID=UPI002D3DAF53|nr:response regulator transcription factor [Stackebrandtia sp.]HZE41422.1 response regulator transcription factor [Stackebrandtia sp.]